MSSLVSYQVLASVTSAFVLVFVAIGAFAFLDSVRKFHRRGKLRVRGICLVCQANPSSRSYLCQDCQRVTQL